MQVIPLKAMMVFLITVLFFSVPAYAVDANDSKLVKCFKHIEKNEKKLQEQKVSSKKRKWKAESQKYTEEAKQAAARQDGAACLDLMSKAVNMRKFGYEN